MDVDALRAAFPEGGSYVAMGVCQLSSLAKARRALRAQLLADAADAAIAGSYECAVWIGWPAIREAAALIRRERVRMVTQPNPFDHLEFVLSEATALGRDDSDPPVMLLGKFDVTRPVRSG
jgi:hypothetical protein